MFSRLHVSRVVGIEVDAELAEVARENAVPVRGRRASIEILQ